MTPVLVTDVTLREHGQNVPADLLEGFSPEERATAARRLAGAGLRRLEILSCVSPRVAPAMAHDQVRPLLGLLGPLEGVEVVTLVPNRRGLDAFLALGLDTRRHTVGLFHSAMDAHNLPNLGRTVEESRAGCGEVARLAAELGLEVAGYVSAAFGFVDRQGTEHRVSHEILADHVRAMFDLGANRVTLSDLQGLASPERTERTWAMLLDLDGGRFAERLASHPHHTSPDAAVDLVEAAWRAGVRAFDASLGAAGGCITGAPGNAPTLGVLRRLQQLGAHTGIDLEAIEALRPEWLPARRP